MTQLTISDTVASKLQQLSEKSSATIDEFLSRLLSIYETGVEDADGDSDDLTHEEIKAALNRQTFLTAAEIIEQGLYGGWKDHDDRCTP